MARAKVPFKRRGGSGHGPAAGARGAHDTWLQAPERPAGELPVQPISLRADGRRPVRFHGALICELGDGGPDPADLLRLYVTTSDVVVAQAVATSGDTMARPVHRVRTLTDATDVNALLADVRASLALLRPDGAGGQFKPKSVAGLSQTALAS